MLFRSWNRRASANMIGTVTGWLSLQLAGLGLPDDFFRDSRFSDLHSFCDISVLMTTVFGSFLPTGSTV